VSLEGGLALESPPIVTLGIIHCDIPRPRRLSVAIRPRTPSTKTGIDTGIDVHIKSNFNGQTDLDERQDLIDPIKDNNIQS
jgi:hypothetical protein